MDLTLYNSLADLESSYKDTPESHANVWNTCLAGVNSTAYLKEHRDYIDANHYGYGDRPYHFMWHLIVKAMPTAFNFLEIGVFQGQVLSLIARASEQNAKLAACFGVTPLDQTGDQYATHPRINYRNRIKALHEKFNVRQPTIIQGMSYDPRVKSQVRRLPAFDLVYIDGCHDFDVVVDDLETYVNSPILKPGGYVVIDDAANDLDIPDDLIPTNFKGLQDVTDALLACALQSRGFKHVAAVGHNRIFKKGTT